MALGRTQESKITPSAFYTATISIYAPYIGSDEAKLLAERIDSDIEKINNKTGNIGLIVNNLLNTLGYIYKKTIFQEKIKIFNKLRCPIIESMIPHASTADALRMGQELITISTHKLNMYHIDQTYKSLIENELSTLLQAHLPSTIDTPESEAQDELADEISTLIERDVESLKPQLISGYQIRQDEFFDKARLQGMSVIDSINARSKFDRISLPIDQEFEYIMDLVYANWKMGKSKEELDLINFPLLKATLMLDLGLEEYLTYTPDICVAASELSATPSANKSLAAQEKQSTAGFIVALLARSLFGDRAAPNLSYESATEECKNDHNTSRKKV